MWNQPGENVQNAILDDTVVKIVFRVYRYNVTEGVHTAFVHTLDHSHLCQPKEHRLRVVAVSRVKEGREGIVITGAVHDVVTRDGFEKDFTALVQYTVLPLIDGLEFPQAVQERVFGVEPYVDHPVIPGGYHAQDLG